MQEDLIGGPSGNDFLWAQPTAHIEPIEKNAYSTG